MLIMNKQKIDKFRQLLINKRDELESLTEIGEKAAQTVELDQSKVGALITNGCYAGTGYVAGNQPKT